MKIAKKLLSIVLVLTLVFSMVACSKDDDKSQKEQDTVEQTDRKEDAEKKDDAEGKDEEEGKANLEACTLKYANWNLGTEEENNIERQMIQAFMDKYPDIKIEIDESIDPADWPGSLATAAAAGTLPDVFMLQNIPTSLSNEWLLDITDLTKKDDTWNDIPTKVSETTVYGGKVMAVPFAEHFMGYFINKDIFNEENVDAPEFGFTTDEFKKVVEDMTKLNKGLVGLAIEDQIVEWYPASVNDAFGFYTWDGKKFNLDSQEFKDGIGLAKSFFNNGNVYSALTDEQKANINGENDYEAWQLGHIAMEWDGTWMIAPFHKELDFEWEFVGVPGGRTVIATDYLGIAKSTEHPREAYEFAKWMSFSKEGFEKRLEISEASDILVNTLPLNTDKELLDKFFDHVQVAGLREAYENIDKAIVEGVKIVPGYADARWNGQTGVKIGDKDNSTIGDVIWNSFKGNLKIEDYAEELDKLANKIYEEAKSGIE